MQDFALEFTERESALMPMGQVRVGALDRGKARGLESGWSPVLEVLKGSVETAYGTRRRVRQGAEVSEMTYIPKRMGKRECMLESCRKPLGTPKPLSLDATGTGRPYKACCWEHFEKARQEEDAKKVLAGTKPAANPQECVEACLAEPILDLGVCVNVAGATPESGPEVEPLSGVCRRCNGTPCRCKKSMRKEPVGMTQCRQRLQPGLNFVTVVCALAAGLGIWVGRNGTVPTGVSTLPGKNGLWVEPTCDKGEESQGAGRGPGKMRVLEGP